MWVQNWPYLLIVFRFYDTPLLHVVCGAPLLILFRLIYSESSYFLSWTLHIWSLLLPWLIPLVVVGLHLVPSLTIFYGGCSGVKVDDDGAAKHEVNGGSAKGDKEGEEAEK